VKGEVVNDGGLTVRLNRLVNWYRVADNKMQIVSPDGTSITISDADIYAPLINQFEHGKRIDGTDEQAKELVTLLQRMGCLIEGSETQSGVYFEDYAKFCAKLTNSKHPHPITPPKNMTVVGEGGLGNTVREMTSLKSNGSNWERDSLIVALADWEDRDFFNTQFKKAVDASCSILPIRWVENRLFVGPLTLYGEGPCYKCYSHRAIASTNHVPEFHAQQTQEPSSSVVRTDDEVISNFVRYIIGRQITLVMTGAFDQATLGSVERWEPYTGSMIKGIVHKIPYCEMCGGAQTDDPIAAVRDLI